MINTLEHAVLVAIAPDDELVIAFGDLRESLEELVSGARLAVLLEGLVARGEVSRYEGGLYHLTPAGQRRVAAGPEATTPARPNPRRQLPLTGRRVKAPVRRDRPGARIGPWTLVAPVPGKRTWIAECACGVLARYLPSHLRSKRKAGTLKACSSCAPRVTSDASREWAFGNTVRPVRVTP